MLTRFVRIQLVVFAILSVIGMVVMAVNYLQVGTMLGIGRITVTLELPSAGGVYRFSNVTYRGTQMGKVTSIHPTADGAEATMSLVNSPQIPADLQAEVRSVSAIGEQYVELLPRTDAPPYLHDGSVIPAADITMPQHIGPLLDQVSALLASIPKDSLTRLLDESSKGLGGGGDDLGSLFDSSAAIAQTLAATAPQTRSLIEDTGPLLDSQVRTADSIRSWTRSLAGITTQLTVNDPQLRGLLQRGPDAIHEVNRLIEQIKPTLPVLLANLTSVGQVGVTYHASLEQLLVLLPPLTSYFIAAGPHNNFTGMGMGDFRLTLGDPPPCTVGYLPPSQWRAPDDLGPIDTPDGLYCKLPQDAPIAVRGARNYPCMDHPGKRAPTVEECDSDKPYQPLAERQHALGPYPFDPNLIGQGIPPDSRVDAGERLYPPPSGTPPPTPDSTQPPAGADGSAAPNPAPPGADPAPPPPNGQPVAPQSASGAGLVGPTPNATVAVARYDPATGKYVGPDGQIYQQNDLTISGAPRGWQSLVLPG